MKNTVNDLRNHLFETLEALKDADNPMEVERAKAICNVAQTIINSAKVEVEMAKAIGAEKGSAFFEAKRDTLKIEEAPMPRSKAV